MSNGALPFPHSSSPMPNVMSEDCDGPARKSGGDGDAGVPSRLCNESALQELSNPHGETS